MKLNYTRNFGVVTGHLDARYEQDGKLFNANGLEIVQHDVIQDFQKETVDGLDKRSTTGQRKQKD